jgi:hypothetical protein
MFSQKIKFNACLVFSTFIQAAHQRSIRRAGIAAHASVNNSSAG